MRADGARILRKEPSAGPGPRPRAARTPWRAARVAAGLAALSALAFGLAAVLALSRDPGLPPMPAPTAGDVATAAAVLGRARADLADGAVDLAVTADEGAALLAVAARLFPGPRAALRLETGLARVEVALPVTFAARQAWLILHAEVPDFAGGPRLAAVRLGALPLPPGVAQAALRAALARAAGPETAAGLWRLADRLAVTGDRLRLVSAPGAGRLPGPLARGDLKPRALAALRGAPLPDGAEVAAGQRALEAALADGRLAAEGSALPHLLFMLDRAAAAVASGADPDRAWTAAILALTRACGSEHIRPEIADLVPGGAALDALPLGDSPCGDAGLHGRVDQRRHFVTAAALRALAPRGPAIAVGELKELSDMTGGGAGFDMTDLAANQSGIRLSDALLGTPPAGWPGLRARISTEADVIAPLGGLPGETPRAAFEAQIGGLDAPAYAALFAEIEARIDALALHRP